MHDGIFSVAMTLLVLDVRLPGEFHPRNAAELSGAIANLWPKFLLVAGGGGLAPMWQLPEGVFSVFSAGYKQTALDRLSNDDNSPNSVFTRTFARELL